MASAETLERNKLLEKPTIRWGVLGTAQTARKRILPAMNRARLQDGEGSIQHSPVAIAGRDEVELIDFQESFHISSTTKWSNARALIESSKIDAVYIPLPNALHAEWVTCSLIAGKHVLCEKPIALSLSELNQALSATTAGGPIIEENFSYHLTPGYAKLCQLCKTQERCKLKSVKIYISYQAQRRHKIRFERFLGGGCFLDLGCYGVDFLHRFLGETFEVSQIDATPMSAEQASWSSSPDAPVDAECFVEGSTSSGTCVEIHTSFNTPPQQIAEIESSTGDIFRLPTAFRVECTSSELICKKSNGKRSYFHFADFDADLAILNDFGTRVTKREGLKPSQVWRWRENTRQLALINNLVLELLDAP